MPYQPYQYYDQNQGQPPYYPSPYAYSQYGRSPQNYVHQYQQGVSETPDTPDTPALYQSAEPQRQTQPQPQQQPRFEVVISPRQSYQTLQQPTSQAYYSQSAYPPQQPQYHARQQSQYPSQQAPSYSPQASQMNYSPGQPQPTQQPQSLPQPSVQPRPQPSPIDTTRSTPKYSPQQQQPRAVFDAQAANTSQQQQSQQQKSMLHGAPLTTPRPQPPRQQQSRILQDMQPYVPRQQIQVQIPSQLKQEKPTQPTGEPDYAILLLSLADEYIEAATNLGERSEEYCKLIATALGCMNSILNKFSLSPVREAQLCIRYAQLLYDETDNNDDAERILTKAIELCHRNKLVDLKYAMQLLLARVLYRSKPKAALKDLEVVIEDLEVFHHTAWEYAFRFEHVAMALSLSSGSDFHSSITQLQRIAVTARSISDHAILAFASVMEALIHLSYPSADSVTALQAALANARALQLNLDVAENPQLMIMMEFVDLCSAIKESDVQPREDKRKLMQRVLYDSFERAGWKIDGTIMLPISARALKDVKPLEGGLVTNRNGKLYLNFSWLSKEEVETLGYLLSAASISYKNGGDGGKAEKFIKGGLELAREPLTAGGSLPLLILEMTKVRRRVIECHFLIEEAFLQCSRGDWKSARGALGTALKAGSTLGSAFPQEMVTLAYYIKAAIAQGSGELDVALGLLQSPFFDLRKYATPQTTSKHSQSKQHGYETIRNISILAAMNQILIIHIPAHPQHSRLTTLLNTIDPLVHTSRNQHVKAAYQLLLSIFHSNTILKTKQYLGNALAAAKQCGNAQITALALALMQEKFFKGIQSDQAAKCAKAASHQANRVGEPMWMAVTSTMEAECFEANGSMAEAQVKNLEAHHALMRTPGKVREKLQAA